MISEYAYLTHLETPVIDGSLMEWDTTTIPNGVHFLRLIVVDNTGNYWEELAEV